MSGKAMLTIVTSSSAMKTATEVTSRTSQRRAKGLSLPSELLDETLD
jgi:hypothetical protein